MIGRGRAAFAREVLTPHSMRVEISAPGVDIGSRQLAELGKRGRKSSCSGSTDGIGPIRRDHTPLPPAAPNRLVMFESIVGRFGGRDDFDLEPLEQRAREKLGRAQRVADSIVVVIGSAARRAPPRGRTPGRRRSSTTATWVCHRTGRNASRTFARPDADRSTTRRPSARLRVPAAIRPGCRAFGADSDRASRATKSRSGTAGSMRTTLDRCDHAD